MFRKEKASLSEFEQMEVKFLKTAIHFIPHASEEGADLGNAAFTFALPDTHFVLISGAGDWEYFFSQDDKNEIIDRRCNWKPLHYYLWDEVKYFSKIPQHLGNALSIVNGGKYLKNALENP